MAPCRRLRRRKATRILLLLFLISTSPSPPLSRSLETTELRVPAADPCYERSYECKQREQLTSMLLTPAFMVHLVLMAGLAILFTLLLLDLVLKMVYVSCSGVVKLMTPCSLPAAQRVTISEKSSLLANACPTEYKLIHSFRIMNGAKADTITVFVRGNHGELHLLTNLSWSSNTNEIFSQMNARTGVPCSVMRLLLGQKAIEPNQTLKKSGITIFQLEEMGEEKVTMIPL